MNIKIYPQKTNIRSYGYDRFYLDLCLLLILPTVIVFLLYVTGGYEDFTYVAFEKAKRIFENILCGSTLSVSFFLLLHYARKTEGKR